MSKEIVIRLQGIQGISKLSGTDQHGLTWTQFEVDYLAEQEDGECVECHDTLSSGWMCMDGGDELCAEHVRFDCGWCSRFASSIASEYTETCTKHTPSRSTKAVPSSHSKWTRQTYEMVAQCVRDVARSHHPHRYTECSECYADAVVAVIVDNLSVQFHLDNPNFDRDRFIQACTLVNKRGPISQADR